MPNVFHPLLQPLFSQCLKYYLLIIISQCGGGNIKLLEGSLRAIAVSLQDANDDRISHHIKEALPLVLGLIGNETIKSNERMLERAWMILYQYMKSLNWANGTDDEIIKEALDPYFSHIENFIEEIFTSTKYEQLIDVKRISVRVRLNIAK